ncbi:DUF3099 domain-containing protein [Cryptosporangium aurantiacum]|uniref:DUF3099 domain-containing protein n=1 Tax=Cryptosporangium aurantiacum TaxID=134849 RepID=UPI0015C05186|nr:DUF3099 domain-containing protein [Cryptosporangium aurantiacum]
MQTRRSRVEVITGADRSPADQLRRRQWQYFGLMMLRVVCLIVAAILVSLEVPYALAWVLFLTVGMVAFPWIAVMVANDRPPREENRFTNRLRRSSAGARAVATHEQGDDVRRPERPELDARELPPSSAKVIDPDD